MRTKLFLSPFIFLFTSFYALYAQQLTTAGVPAQLILRKISNGCIRITLAPVSYHDSVQDNPSLVTAAYTGPVIRLHSLDKAQTKIIGGLVVQLTPSPLTIRITNKQKQLIQQ